jgi:WD40 repeat protein
MKHALVFCTMLVAMSAHAAGQTALKYHGNNHLGAIHDIAVDFENEFIYSAGNDGVIKQWSLASGQQLKSLYPPDISGKGGQLNAVAVHPRDGRVAVGGSIRNSQGKALIFLLSSEQKMLGAPLTADDTVTRLAISTHNPNQLIAGTARGVEVFDLKTRRSLKKIGIEAQVTQVLHFKSGNWLVADSKGMLRRFDRDWSATGKIQLPFEQGTGSLAVDPTGRYVAASALGKPDIRIIDANTLTEAFSLKLDKIDHGDLAQLSWAGNGTLLASGSFGPGNSIGLVKWSGEQLDSRQLATLDRRITSRLIALPDGDVLFATHRPSIGRIGPQGQMRYLNRSQLTDAPYSRIQIDNTTELTLNLHGDDGSVQINLDRMALQSSRTLSNSPPREALPQVYDQTFQLNGTYFSLADGERLRALETAGDKSFVSSDFGLRGVTAKGRQLFSRPTQAAVWDLAYDTTRDYLFALEADGVIRLYQGGNGRHLLDLIVNRDNGQWVAYTPAGYFFSSGSPRNMLAWVESRASDQLAAAFDITLFQEQYYDANLLQKLGQKPVQKPVQADSQTEQQSGPSQLPPQVEIVSHSATAVFSEPEIELRYRLTTKTAVSEVKVLVDGRPLPDTRGLSRSKDTSREIERTVSITLPRKDSIVSIVARADQLSSSPATVKFVWTGAQEQNVIKPRLYLLTVGVSDYDNDEYDLAYAAKDARDLAATIRQQQGRLYRSVEVNEKINASRDEVLAGLEWLNKEVTARDVAMIFIAGHGVNDNTGDYYFVPSNGDIDSLTRTGVSYYEIRKTLNNLPGKTILFADTCHSGNILGGMTRRAIGDVNRVVMDLTSADNGVVVFASSSGRQYSLENPAWGNGAFTKALIEGFQGKADFFSKGVITVNTLDAYIAERVKELTDNQQTPTTSKPETVSDFPLAILP